MFTGEGLLEEGLLIYKRKGGGTTKQYCFTVDDNIRFFEEAVSAGSASIFDTPYMGLLRALHRRHGCKIQLNMFWRYGPGGFSLAEVPDSYRDELGQTADWLKFSFHSLENEPPFPYEGRNQALLEDYDRVTKELYRIAGKKAVAETTTIHYVTAEKESGAALRQRGLRALIGMFLDMPGREALRYWLTGEESEFFRKHSFYHDKSTDLVLARNDMVVNQLALGEIVPRLEQVTASEGGDGFVQLMIHEQYFYPDYEQYQPDFGKKLDEALTWLSRNKYETCFLEEVLPESITA